MVTAHFFIPWGLVENSRKSKQRRNKYSDSIHIQGFQKFGYELIRILFYGYLFFVKLQTINSNKTMKRRRFLSSCASIGAGAYLSSFLTGCSQNKSQSIRRYSLCVSTGVLDQNPDLFDVIAESGITDAWLAGWLNGYWYYPVERIEFWRKRFLEKGIAAHILNVPLGHPADLSASKAGSALGIEGEIPNITPKHWKKKTTSNGTLYSGVSIHPPIVEENIEAMKRAKGIGFKKVFLDDDYRLGIYPGMVGGCFCPEHKQEFLAKYGYNENAWNDLLDNIKQREITDTLYSWVNYTCDRLSAAYKQMQSAVPDIQLGIMVMYMGAEKSGIRLADYKGSLMRVGEMMFGDDSFGRVKGKTDELFSSLFHRRYVAPELAFSETTAYPPENLSAKNLAAKLNVSLLSDVRNTMFMSGLTTFPPEYWSTLSPAMKKSADLHAKIAGQKPSGPFKHYWGEASRFISTDKPNSLFLASGVPFEVTDVLSEDGWTFLSEFDARSVMEGKLKNRGTKLIHNKAEYKDVTAMKYVPETMDDIFSFKREIISSLTNVPYVEEDLPIACAWYPSINSMLLWNLSETPEKLTIVYGDKRFNVDVEGLNAEVILLS
ncbi:hypothetical protein D1164_02765 [Mariniphaga sediminis]|uniref:Uncharacterized protein n=2 Tax=Mariniphaga sediminis TaxID=1628158 RepID=A0A399CWY9_9BACT|nr:hypothetical protein D1164_15720 [Mariniphaga sediminis]RIH66544.1 hypothetical protein D1164_02765 [Mariniphaga sediminis]